LAPLDLLLFSRIKTGLSERTKAFLETFSAEGLKTVFDGQVDDKRHVIARHGIYYDPRTSHAESLLLIPFPFLCGKNILTHGYVGWLTFYCQKLSLISTGNRDGKGGVEHLVVLVRPFLPFGSNTTYMESMSIPHYSEHCFGTADHLPCDSWEIFFLSEPDLFVLVAGVKPGFV
jgi:hypothetical protein